MELGKEVVQTIPQLLCPLRGGSQEGLVPLVGFIVLLNKVANIDLLLPETCSESLPSGGNFVWRYRV
jgi:hypothetical protein